MLFGDENPASHSRQSAWPPPSFVKAHGHGVRRVSARGQRNLMFLWRNWKVPRNESLKSCHADLAVALPGMPITR
jgi:hypothetical protein